MSDNPVFEGLAEGLKPSDVISSRDLALIGIDAKLARLADAAERQADAFETFVTLFASCIGTATAFCPGRAEGETPPVNFLRASADGKPFRCDAAPDGADDE